MSYQLSSIQNPKIAHALGLKNKSKNRKKFNQFIAEGLQECKMALETDYTHEFALYCPDFISQDQLIKTIPNLQTKPIFSCSVTVFAQVAYRHDAPNVVIIGNQKQHQLEQFKKPEQGFLLICESLEKPGNLGAIARSANAFGAAAIILTQALCDIYNPNSLRASMGALYSTPIFYATNLQAQEFLNQNQIPTFITHMHSTAQSLHQLAVPPLSAWVLGTEHHGLSAQWLQTTYNNVIIPMCGTIDSLNVSNAAAILFYHLHSQTLK